MTERESRTDSLISRRGLLAGAGIAVGSATLAGVAGHAVGRSGELLASETAVGSAIEPFFGPHQAGIRTAMQAHGTFATFTLRPKVDASALRGVMRVATIEAERLTRGVAGMSDLDPELAVNPSRLTVTFGFGPAVFRLPGIVQPTPTGFGELPSFPVDRLEKRWTGGDLLVHVGGDDSMTVSHAVRHMTRVVSSIAQPHFAQRGFVRAQGVAPHEQTPRNHFGHVDGVANPRTDDEFDSHIWAPSSSGWFAGGTQLVLRRIAMNLPAWDRLGRGDKEKAFGRRLSDGAPLSGNSIADRPDFEATNDDGLTVIPDYSHMARAHTGEGRQLFLRRPFSYDDGFRKDGTPDVGLLFTAYAQNIAEQFTPVQQSLAEFDILNLWTTPIGSSEFALPPGCREGGYVGETLLG